MVDKPAPEFKVDCPSCGAPMVERPNTKRGGTFMGCTNYAGDEPGSCTETMPVPAYVILKRAGAAVLPGFE